MEKRNYVKPNTKREILNSDIIADCAGAFKTSNGTVGFIPTNSSFYIVVFPENDTKDTKSEHRLYTGLDTSGNTIYKFTGITKGSDTDIVGYNGGGGPEYGGWHTCGSGQDACQGNCEYNCTGTNVLLNYSTDKGKTFSILSSYTTINCE